MPLTGTNGVVSENSPVPCPSHRDYRSSAFSEVTGMENVKDSAQSYHNVDAPSRRNGASGVSTVKSCTIAWAHSSRSKGSW